MTAKIKKLIFSGRNNTRYSIHRFASCSTSSTRRNGSDLYASVGDVGDKGEDGDVGLVLG